MKTLRLIGMAIVAIVMSVNFTSCSDDDDDIDIAQLEGTWGLVRDEGYEHYEGEKESWNDSYDPANPTEDCEKIVLLLLLITMVTNGIQVILENSL